MTDNIANALGIEKQQINIKATTEEGLGFTGSGEGISAQAVAMLLTAENYKSYDVAQPSGCGGCGGCPNQAGQNNEF